jgi:galactonate dehydratase
VKITKVEPLLVDRFWLVRIETDDGISGIGEAGVWGQLEASATAISKYAEYMIGNDPRQIEHHWNVMLRANHFIGAAISGAVSAIDIACGTSKANTATCRSINCSAARCGIRRASTVT